MVSRFWILIVLMALTAGNAAAQDARTVLQATMKAMGAENVKCIQYSGKGYLGLVGQQYDLKTDWPKIEISAYSRTINYETNYSLEERTVRQGNYPARGGGFQPIQGERRDTFLLSGGYAWNLQGGNPVPAPAAVELRQLEILVTPNGFLRAAMAANDAKALTRYESGAIGSLSSLQRRKATIVSFTALGKYRVNGQINDQNMLTRVQTRIASPVLGDINFETEYSDYKDFGGVKFPTRFHHHDAFDDETQPPNYNGGHNGFDYRLSDVRPNQCGPAPAVPDAVRQAAIPPVRVEPRKIADGVWILAGGSSNSIAVEFKDFVTVVEAPVDEVRSIAVIEEVKKLIPDKPIEYLVNTHHHFDHLGGVRSYVFEGATIITHALNYEFYKHELISHEPWTIAPDRLSLYPPTELDEGYIFETVDFKHSVNDGSRILDIYYVQNLAHSNDMLMVYLPKEKIIIEADLFTGPAPGAPLPAAPIPSSLTFYDNVKALKLDVTTIAPIHGYAYPWADFVKYLGKSE